MFRLTLLTLLISSTMAFQVSLPAFAPPKAAVSSTARFIKLVTDAETEKMMKSAADCAEGECTIDDVSELIYELQEQQMTLQERLDKVSVLITDLERLNTKDSRKTDEVRAFVRDMLRVFNNEKPGFFPTGFSGDIGDGPKTAYDVLNPKKWKGNVSP